VLALAAAGSVFDLTVAVLALMSKGTPQIWGQLKKRNFTYANDGC
jgi:hypothetical protein